MILIKIMSRAQVLKAVDYLDSLHNVANPETDILGGAMRRRRPAARPRSRAGRGGGLVSQPAPFGYGGCMYGNGGYGGYGGSGYGGAGYGGAGYGGAGYGGAGYGGAGPGYVPNPFGQQYGIREAGKMLNAQLELLVKDENDRAFCNNRPQVKGADKTDYKRELLDSRYAAYPALVTYLKRLYQTGANNIQHAHDANYARRCNRV